MTDREKAEKILQTKGCNTFCAKGCGYTDKVIELIAIGLAEMKAKIEKMKCCENCKFWQNNDCIVKHDYDCKRWNNTNTDDFWELAE